jgi:predicted acetyltransferase
MDVRVERIPIEEKPVLRNLMELCRHDFSDFDGSEVSPHGLFGYRYIDNYWTEEDRYPLFIKVGDKLAGFALVREIGEAGWETTHSMAEYFILRKYRRQGVGTAAACQVFDMFSGRWSVSQEELNTAAQAFWQKVIGEYTGGQYTKRQEEKGPVLEF